MKTQSIGERVAEKLKPYFTNDVGAAERIGIEPTTTFDVAKIIDLEIAPLIETLRKIARLYGELIPTKSRDKFLNDQVRQARQIALSALAQAAPVPEVDHETKDL